MSSMNHKNYKLSETVKLGHLLYNDDTKTIVRVTIKVLEDLIKLEKTISQSDNGRYYNISLSHDLLVKGFNFNFKYLNAQAMTIYTLPENGFKVQGQQGRFTLPYTSREKSKIAGMSGQIISKAKIEFVNDLIDYLWLLQRQLYVFKDDNLNEINRLFKIG